MAGIFIGFSMSTAKPRTQETNILTLQGERDCTQNINRGRKEGIGGVKDKRKRKKDKMRLTRNGNEAIKKEILMYRSISLCTLQFAIDF
jgi:hypothetical protein